MSKESLVFNQKALSTNHKMLQGNGKSNQINFTKLYEQWDFLNFLWTT